MREGSQEPTDYLASAIPIYLPTNLHQAGRVQKNPLYTILSEKDEITQFDDVARVYVCLTVVVLTNFTFVPHLPAFQEITRQMKEVYFWLI